MSTTFELIDQLYRSRKTILQILEDRDYNIKPYENFGPAEIEAMLVATATNRDKDKSKEKGTAFRIDVERKQFNPDAKDLEEREKAKKWQDSPIKKCRVIYTFNRLKNRLASFMTNITDPEREDYVNPADTELIVILALPEGEPVVESFHTEAYKQWSSPSKFRISFFRLANLVIHPSSHILVPKHEYVPKSAVPFSATEKLKLPFIRFHEDMQARLLGLVPGDIVKITRPSPAAGEYTLYRICA
jgi:DNA-directed RNA polymerase subunit H